MCTVDRASIEASFENGVVTAVIVGIVDGYGRNPPLALDPDTVMAEYRIRNEAVRDRNPDMTPHQIHDLATARWYLEVARKEPAP